MSASYYVVDEMKSMTPDEALRINVAETVSGDRLPRWEKLGLGIPMSSGQQTRRARTYAVGDYTMAYVRNDRQKPVQRWCDVAQHMTGDRVCIHTYQDWTDWQNYGSLSRLWWKNFTWALWGINDGRPEDPQQREARKLSMENFTAKWLDSTNKS
jgi:hypothetical protein